MQCFKYFGKENVKEDNVLAKEKYLSKEKLIDLIYDVTGSILYSIGIYTFATMADFAPGGLTGVALIMNHLWNLPIGIMTILLNIPFVICSYKVVGKRFLLKTTKTMLLCTFFLDIVFTMLPVYTGSKFIAAVYSGVFLGAGLSMFYMRGSSSGGTDFLTMTVKAMYPHLSIGAVTMTIDLAVILLGWPVFGKVDAVLYGLAATFITSLVIDKIMYGSGAGTLAIIITNKGQLAAEKISEITGRGSTCIPAVGTYTGQNRDVLLCACSNSQSYVVKKAVHGIDPDAFVMLTETSQVFGEGFVKDH